MIFSQFDLVLRIIFLTLAVFFAHKQIKNAFHESSLTINRQKQTLGILWGLYAIVVSLSCGEIWSGLGPVTGNILGFVFSLVVAGIVTKASKICAYLTSITLLFYALKLFVLLVFIFTFPDLKP